jgi:hypothetical protein
LFQAIFLLFFCLNSIPPFSYRQISAVQIKFPFFACYRIPGSKTQYSLFLFLQSAASGSGFRNSSTFHIKCNLLRSFVQPSRRFSSAPILSVMDRYIQYNKTFSFEFGLITCLSFFLSFFHVASHFFSFHSSSSSRILSLRRFTPFFFLFLLLSSTCCAILFWVVPRVYFH